MTDIEQETRDGVIVQEIRQHGNSGLNLELILVVGLQVLYYLPHY